MKKGDFVTCEDSYVTYVTPGKNYEILAVNGDFDLDKSFTGMVLWENTFQIKDDEGEILFLGYPSCLVGKWSLVK